MIREHELRDAIMECQSEKNPNANTCIKLAAYYTLLNNMYPEAPEKYSYKTAPEYNGRSEFAEAIKGKPVPEVMGVVDELMDALRVLSPRLYNATIVNLTGI